MIEHYLKFFRKPFYKLDPPIEGKPADVMNKLGVVALFNRDEDSAMRYWCEAKQINRRHFDSTCNYILHRWSTARINDERMMQEFDEFIFDVPNKGVCLKAVLLLAKGDTEMGLQTLKDYISKTEAEINSVRVPPQKQISYLEQA